MNASLQADLKFGSPLHDKILNMVRDRARLSRLKMASRHTKWSAAEDMYLCYTKESPDDAKRKARKKSGQQDFLTITIPYSYATLLTAHTYWSSVFLSRNPIYQFTSRHGGGQQKIQAVEAVMDYQVAVGKMVTALYLWLLDAGK